jgi:hypothetical protein
MALKLSPERAAEVKAALANVKDIASELDGTRDTATAKAILNRLHFALKDASDAVIDAEAEANGIRSAA